MLVKKKQKKKKSINYNFNTKKGNLYSVNATVYNRPTGSWTQMGGKYSKVSFDEEQEGHFTITATSLKGEPILNCYLNHVKQFRSFLHFFCNFARKYVI
jgi:hypothetical protein